MLEACHGGTMDDLKQDSLTSLPTDTVEVFPNIRPRFHNWLDFRTWKPQGEAFEPVVECIADKKAPCAQCGRVNRQFGTIRYGLLEVGSSPEKVFWDEHRYCSRECHAAHRKNYILMTGHSRCQM